jgi:hypothetical protein
MQHLKPNKLRDRFVNFLVIIALLRQTLRDAYDWQNVNVWGKRNDAYDKDWRQNHSKHRKQLLSLNAPWRLDVNEVLLYLRVQHQDGSLPQNPNLS